MVTLPRETYNNLSVKAALYDGRNEKALAETRAVRNAAEAVEKRYNNAVSLEYNAFEREIREKELVAENEELRRKLMVIRDLLKKIDELLSKHTTLPFVKPLQRAIRKAVDYLDGNKEMTHEKQPF